MRCAQWVCGVRSGCAVGTRCEWWEQDALAASEHTFHLKTVHTEPRTTRVGEELARESVNAPANPRGGASRRTRCCTSARLPARSGKEKPARNLMEFRWRLSQAPGAGLRGAAASSYWPDSQCLDEGRFGMTQSPACGRRAAASAAVPRAGRGLARLWPAAAREDRAADDEPPAAAAGSRCVIAAVLRTVPGRICRYSPMRSVTTLAAPDIGDHLKCPLCVCRADDSRD